MAIVYVVSSSLYADSQSKSVGLVCCSATAWRSSTFVVVVVILLLLQADGLT